MFCDLYQEDCKSRRKAMIEVENSGLEVWGITLWENTCPSFDARYWDGRRERRKQEEERI